MSTGERIRGLREKSEISQSELAELLGITRTAVWAWEKGITIPRQKTLVVLADLFGVTLDFLAGRDQLRSAS